MEIKAHSKVGSMDNVKHRPGGGEVKIFDDKNYAKQTAGGGQQQIGGGGTPTKSQVNRCNKYSIMYSGIDGWYNNVSLNRIRGAGMLDDHIVRLLQQQRSFCLDDIHFGSELDTFLFVCQQNRIGSHESVLL